MFSGNKFLHILLLLLVNFVILASIEYISYVVIERNGLKRQSTRIFNAMNGRDDSFIVQFDEKLGYQIIHPNVDTDKYVDSIGRTFHKKKPGGVYRILCLGGSTTYGVGADKTNSYPSQLEKILQSMYARCGVRFEVLNFGVMGYHSWHSRIRYETELASLEPDLILVMDAANDLASSTLADNSLSFAQEKERLLRLTNSTNTNFFTIINNFLYKNINTYVLLKYLIARIHNNLDLKEKHSSREKMRRDIESFGYRQNMIQLATLTRYSGAEFMIINYPWLASDRISNNDPPLLASASNELYRFGRSWFPEANASIVQQTGTMLINPQPIFDFTLSSKTVPLNHIYFDEIHFTKVGNQLLARVVAEGIALSSSLSKMSTGCELDPIENALKLLDPQVHFSNGWPREGEKSISSRDISFENISLYNDEIEGYTKVVPTKSDVVGKIRFFVGEQFESVPMTHTYYPAFWFPRVSCSADKVEVLAGNRTVFSLSGDANCRFTDISSRFGIELPAMEPGSPVEIRLHGNSQIWLKDMNIFFTGDTTHPGY